MKDIHLWGVRQNNLKGVEVRIPLGKFTVICGPSGSGKSSLAFETLFAEGQRRFIESMSTYARQFLNKAPKPDVEGVENIPPAISIEQKNSVRSSRSTVGTTTEITDYLRLLFEKTATAYCPNHDLPTQKFSVTEATAKVLEAAPNSRAYVLVEVPEKGRLVEGKKLHSLLLQEGFLRIVKGISKDEIGEMIELSDAKVLKSGLPKTKFYVVIDRLVVSEEERERLADSLGQAYEASLKFLKTAPTRRALVVTTKGEVFKFSEERACPKCDFVAAAASTQLFSFNSPVGACVECKGYGNILQVDPKKVIPNPSLSIANGALEPFEMPSAAKDRRELLSFCKSEKIPLKTSWEKLKPEQQKMIWEGTEDFFGVLGLFRYLDEIKYKMHVRVFISRYRSPVPCPACEGTRLRPEALTYRLKHQTIAQLSAMTVAELHSYFANLQMSPSAMEVAAEVLKQVGSRLDYLLRVGVHYLTLSRETKTLSGGEYQRLALANQLGMGLSQTLFVLDEPTVGLHPRDNDRLISILKDLQKLGNTLVVVEHDHDVIKNSDYVLEMGPGSGSQGGEVTYRGNTADFLKDEQSLTARYLRPGSNWVPLRVSRPVDLQDYTYQLELRGCTGNNLKNLSVKIPLNRLVSISGVSGSGKSTLVSRTLYPALAAALGVEYIPSSPHKELKGHGYLRNVILIDQSPIGTSARSSPITYLKAFDAVRNLMAQTPEAKALGYTPGTFSLNVDGGRCPVCRGTGFEEIDMMFMDNVMILCDACDGKKFRPEILEVKYKGKNIADILNMTVSEALHFFVTHPNIRRPISVLREVGLDYLQLGQPAGTLSGGESQRLKLAKELSQVAQKLTLYILDEPTTGLHFREIELLMKVLHRLVDGGGSVLLVEHNQDVLLASDYVIDLGPEGGAGGGQVVVAGTPMDVMNHPDSLTGKYLRRYWDEKSGLR